MSDALVHEFVNSLVSGLKGRTLTSCSRWAANRRVMGAPFPGPYSWKYHPWVREILDSEAAFNYAMKAAQIGLTEVAINRAFYVLDVLKRDVLYVLPTALNARDFSKARFAPALKHSPYLASLFTDANTVELKQAGTCNLYIRGSRGDSNLKSIPVSDLILDEVDEMDLSQVWLALERLSGHEKKTVWGLSTPTIPNHGIHKLYLTTTREHFFFVCPHCSKHTELVWPDCIEIIGEAVNDPRCHESFLKCKECKHKLEHKAKPEYLSSGFFKATAPNANPDIRGFHVNQLYSYTVSPGEIVVAHFRGYGDEAAMHEFHKSKLGLPYIGQGAQVTDTQIDAAVKGHSKGDAPPIDGRRLITMGVDQGKWCYAEVAEWFNVEYTHDIHAAAVKKVLFEMKFLEDEWHLLDELMHTWQVRACVIDADPQINEARAFARRFPGFVWLCRYRRGVAAKEIQVTDEDTGAPMATVDRTNWLSCSLGRYKTPGRVLLPHDVSFDYREHIKALVRTYVQDENNNPVATYVETGPDHFAHADTYSEIALPLAAAQVTGKSIQSFW